MALREDRKINHSEVNYQLNDVAAPGVFLCFKTAGSGSAEGDNQGVVQLASSPSGLTPCGVLLQNFVSIDTTKYHENWHKEEQVVGTNCQFATDGWVVTNMISGTPTLGAKAYLTTNGNVTPTKSATGGLAATPYVGEFQGIKDEAGYVKVAFKLPNSSNA